MTKTMKKISRITAITMAALTIMTGCAFAAPFNGMDKPQGQPAQQYQQMQPRMEQNNRHPEPRREEPERRPEPSRNYRRDNNSNDTAKAVGLVALGAVIGGILSSASTR